MGVTLKFFYVFNVTKLHSKRLEPIKNGYTLKKPICYSHGEPTRVNTTTKVL